LLSLGDRRVGQVLSEVHRLDGNWSQALKKVPLNPDFYVYRPKDVSELLPWDFIDQGVEKAVLIREYQQALSASPSLD